MVGTSTPSNACVYKLSPDGRPLNYRIVCDTGTASCSYAISFYADSTLFLGCAWAIGNSGFSRVIKADTSGVVIKTKEIPLWGMSVLRSAVTFDNKVIGIGERYYSSGHHWETCLFKFNQDLEYDSTYTQVRTYDSLCPYTVTPEESIPLDCAIVGINEPIKLAEANLLRVYPLPAGDQLTLALPERYVSEEKSRFITSTTTYFQLKGEKNIEIYNLQGQKTGTVHLPDGQTSITLDVSNWESGMYVARLVCKGKVWAQGRILIAR